MEFSMTVGNREYSGKGAREDAAKALTYAVLTWRDDLALTPRAQFRGFEILSRGSTMKNFDGEPDLPELFVRGKGTYRAHPNAENPIGTVQSIEHTLRALDRLASDEKDQIERQEKAAADYQVQLNRAFEHEEKLKELLARQQQLNAALDLDKGERQIAEAAHGTESDDKAPSTGNQGVVASFAARTVKSREWAR
jgi:hypothetical protein